MLANPNGAADAVPAGVAPQPEDRRAAGHDPFDLWLRRGLRDLYGAIAAEPVPDDLLRLIGEAHADRDGAWDGPAYRHRGARIECRPGGRICRPVLAGHPLDGLSFGPAGAVVALIDLWLDEGRLPDGMSAGPGG